jgi:predicted TIM-barrel fold metal-dependent hydrolase
LFGHNPKAKIIWAHTGFSTPPQRVAQLMQEHPGALWGELSYRSGITQGGGQLSPEWKALFAKHSGRFMLGSDTWINERWFAYDGIMKEYRGWLAQLPADQAARIANGNAKRLFAKAE